MGGGEGHGDIEPRGKDYARSAAARGRASKAVGCGYQDVEMNTRIHESSRAPNRSPPLPLPLAAPES